MVRELMFAANIEVVQQSHETFLTGLRLYEQRPDKEYSMTGLHFHKRYAATENLRCLDKRPSFYARGIHHSY